MLVDAFMVFRGLSVLKFIFRFKFGGTLLYPIFSDKK